MKSRSIVMALALLVAVTPAVAQEAKQAKEPAPNRPPPPVTSPAPTGRALTLEQAMAIARERNEGVLAARAGVSRARAQVGVAKSAWWPQLGGLFSYERTLASEFDDISFGPPVDPAAPPADDDQALGDLPFGQDNIWRIGFTLSQEIWSFGRTQNRVAIARSAEDQAEINVTSTSAQAAMTAAEAYFDGGIL